jgi:mannan endo-1,4-beta-mannosidase
MRKVVAAARAVVTAFIFVLSFLAGPSTAIAADAVLDHHGKDVSEARNPFVVRKGSRLFLQGKPFRFAGSNNYYPIFKSRFMVDALFDKAQANGFTVMRVWGSLDIGNQDGSNSIDGPGAKEGVYLQYWNGVSPAYNDGPDGLERLDYIIYKARRSGVKLVIPFVNNWNAFGGMDQYVRWRGGQFHDDFYTDAQIRQWYKNWIAHVLNRVNVFTGIRYKNDPTIMTWELGNEPRCLGAGVYPRSETCTPATLVAWADDVSAFIKSIDRNHLVSVGDEGFYCTPGAADWTENCNEGPDSIAFTKLKNIDVMSLHLYPESWGKDTAWGTEWIRRHIQDARALGKPVMLGEYGLRDKNRRSAVYKEWTDTVFNTGGNGALYWILSDLQDDGTLYPDFDQFTVYCPSSVCSTLNNFARTMTTGRPLPYKPVADDDRAEAAFDTVASLSPLANDVAYTPFIMARGSIDLDPATTGQQTAITTASGSFLVLDDDSVSFTPTPGFVGEAVLPYTAKDSGGRRTNAANLRVIVRPAPGAPVILFSFENDTAGWHAVNGSPDAGTVSQSADFATDGVSSLRVDTGTGDWFGTNLSEPVDLSEKTRLKIDIRLVGAGQSHNVALQVGDDFAWCEGTWQNADTDSTTTLEIDLVAMGCRASHNKVRALWLFLGGTRTYYVDSVRAE